MNQLNDILAVARSQIGYKEGAGNYSKYGEWYGIPYGSWCAMFVSWCAWKANISQSIIPKLAYVPYEQEWFAKRGLWKAKGLYRPKAGDLVIYGTNSHIGIVERVTGSAIITIEGNTSSGGDVSNGEGVYRRQRPINSDWIKGYCLPRYIIEEDDMSGEEIYNALQAYLAKQPLPGEWAEKELAEAVALGITDGKNPMQLIPRYQAAIMAKRALKNK